MFIEYLEEDSRIFHSQYIAAVQIAATLTHGEFGVVCDAVEARALEQLSLYLL